MARSRSSVSPAANFFIRSATAPDSSLRAACVSGEAPAPGSRSSRAMPSSSGRGSSEISREARWAETSSTSASSTSSLAASSLGVASNPAGQQLLPLALQPEEQLAPGARVAHVDEARVGHQELQDVGPDPVGGVRAEAGPQGGVPVLDRLQQTHAALLEQVEDVGPGLAVLIGDAHHQPQVVHHQGAGGARVAVLAHLAG